MTPYRYNLVLKIRSAFLIAQLILGLRIWGRDWGDSPRLDKYVLMREYGHHFNSAPLILMLLKY